MEAGLIIQVFLIVIGVYLAFFKSYFKEKGKNIATNEDIEALTLKVESVKQQFLEKNANLKAKLDLLTNLQINYKNDERTTIIDFHKKLMEWIGNLTESFPTLIDDYNDEELTMKIHSYEISYQKYLAAESLLQLYVEDEKLLELITALQICVLENLSVNPKQSLISLKLNNYHIRNLDREQDLDKRMVLHKKLIDERLSIYRDYKDKMLAGLKIVLPSKNKYREYVKIYIKSISL